ncbi:Double Clp-N motif-containing P-loop nucleoside triphosphate hydrolases superfamily protein [Rhynchospora pubera]|uniref:Double Clp-N motif-containing P-loop nucleoside triphosphate hydrolases superfamily protein n=1 Tax=Rhynchospora pubera TaxID=906938 RepID=A0AAV8D921_9POAL|nr:Double Clp-N motif-containing P-loop nucleoside triphosphate hydrolases superfamily protein [Rhynchospora pubera]KAJ4815859.1 Double Clp-N motif-containing P-loop nucleoside triphosphate hydrolases superfamily protein [Rhynchospora pubera]
MRADLSTIQQTLTPEAAAVLSRSIEEAAKRRHGQTTPLHVAASLLSSPSSIFRRACASSSANSPHPLQCRALELCFSVALDRLPSSSSPPNSCPPVSNALMAALKRAQAHQRRGGSGCPDTPQPPLLAVKVELEQLILSILDDPSVSRVMREASFNSSAVKSTIENSLVSTSPCTSNSPPQLGLPQSATIPSAIPSLIQNPNLNLNSSRNNLYMNPRLANTVSVSASAQPVDGLERADEVKKVFDIMFRSNKRNPILVGDSDVEFILKKVLLKISSGQAPLPVNSTQVLNLDPDLSKIVELRGVIEDKLRAANALVINLGDLRWLVEGPGPTLGPPGRGPPVVSEAGRSAVAEIAALLGRFNSEGDAKVWLVGTAACATYMRCQVYHSSMETEWDLQPVPIAAPRPQSTHTSLINPRLLGTGGVLNNSLSTASPLKNVGIGISPMPSAGVIPLRQSPQILLGSTNPTHRGSMCQLCMTGYEHEMGKLVAEQFEKSSSASATTVSKSDSGQSLPHWLRLGPGRDAKSASINNPVQAKDQELMWKNRTEELQKKWRETCSRLHPTKPNTGQPTLSIPSTGPPILSTPIAQNLKLTAGSTKKIMPQLKIPSNPEKPLLTSGLCDNNYKSKSPPGSPVKTDLSLGGPKFWEPLSDQQKAKIAGIADIDSFKKLLKDLKEKVPLQPNAASAVAAVVIQCRAGNSKRRGVVPRGDTWLLFVGADQIGKRKMAVALSESLFGAGPVIVSFGAGDSVDPKMNLWGTTSLDRVVEAVRINPFSVILIEDIDRADTVVRGKIKRAIERGRLPDTHGREVNLGNVTFILTTNWIHGETDPAHETLIQNEERILDLADSGSWQLELSSSTVDESAKHRADWLCDDDRPAKMRKESALSLDLNLAVGSCVDDTCEGSRNSSDLTVEHEPIDKGRLAIRSLMPSPILELIDLVEEAILFEPVDFAPLKKQVLECVTSKFEGILGNSCSIRVDDEVIDRMASGIWVHGAEIEDWIEKVLSPRIQQVKHNFRSADRKLAIRLSTSVSYARKGDSGGLPVNVIVAVDGRW